MTQNNATKLLNDIGVSGSEEVKQIPCGYKEPISEGKTLTCGHVYRGKTFYCRDCLEAMTNNAAGMCSAMLKQMYQVTNDYDLNGNVSPETITGIKQFIDSI